MNKKILTGILLSGLILQPLSANAFINFSNSYGNWNNPYVNRSPFYTFSKIRNSMFPNNNNNYNSSNNDVAYLLSKMEKRRFNENYDNLSIDDRLSKLESNMFGAGQ